jgi:hypothetical protein
MAAGAAGFGLLLAAAGCSSSGGGDNGDSCTPGDNDSVAGGPFTALVNVSDTAYAVGGVDSGSTSPNVAFENLDMVTLTLTNVGTRPHDLVVQCIPSGLPAMCSLQTSCFPGSPASLAGYITIVPSVDPGQSMTVMFKAPLVEGAYAFVSDAPGDSSPDGGLSGPMGEFVLM